ncbi:MAG: hypothetical protein H6712_13265 [Myxococcales bacterium]|nr:hypothetical protein [Myxococcales bacterium]
MVTKLIALAFVAIVLGRVLLGARLRELSAWFHRFIDVTLVVLAVVYGTWLVRLLLSR